jgi:hypothetical protein
MPRRFSRAFFDLPPRHALILFSGTRGVLYFIAHVCYFALIVVIFKGDEFLEFIDTSLGEKRLTGRKM